MIKFLASLLVLLSAQAYAKCEQSSKKLTLENDFSCDLATKKDQVVFTYLATANKTFFMSYESVTHVCEKNPVKEIFWQTMKKDGTVATSVKLKRSDSFKAIKGQQHRLLFKVVSTKPCDFYNVNFGLAQ